MDRRTAEAQASRTLEFGYFQGDQSSQVYVFCPDKGCRVKVSTMMPFGQHGARAATRALVPALADHIEDNHAQVSR